MKFIDDYLNTITMYRLVLYVLIFYLLVAGTLSLLGLLPFKPINLFFSVGVLTTVCWTANKIFARLFHATTNLESVYITALILSLIITPISNFSQILSLLVVAVLSQGSKYILAINKKHLFNPAAFAVFTSALFLKYGASPVPYGTGASWWVGSPYMVMPVILGGLLILRKVRRFSLVLSFLIIYSIFTGPQVIKTILESPIFFFAFIMLTEPQTTPPKKSLQILYGGLVGVITFYQAPEVALLAGNIFSYIISPKEKLLLKLKEKIQLAPDIYDFVFKLDKPFAYNAGQYMEWTLGFSNPDSRGNRRYFTVAASPTERNLGIGVKFYPNGSSFKKSLINMKQGDQIVASQLSGEFILPKDVSKKLVFIAGGIGITPFRSMIKYLLDKEEIRDIVLLYSNQTQSDIVYKNILDEASKKLGIKVVYVNTDTMGYIDDKEIREKVPDFKDRIFYISGPHSMVDAFEKTLKNMGVSKIKIDFFPGYA